MRCTTPYFAAQICIYIILSLASFESRSTLLIILPDYFPLSTQLKHAAPVKCLLLKVLQLTYYMQILLLSCEWLNYLPFSTPKWLPPLLIRLSNDINLNPGPYNNGYFTFMTWNINSLAKEDFQRARLIEAHNTIFNYDLIALTETSLNSLVEVPDPLIDNYIHLYLQTRQMTLDMVE